MQSCPPHSPQSALLGVLSFSIPSWNALSLPLRLLPMVSPLPQNLELAVSAGHVSCFLMWLVTSLPVDVS